MTRKYFGTDGIRGRVNTPPMTPDVAMRVGMAVGRVFRRGDHRHRVLIGKDTRRSGYMFEPALTAGFIASGMDVILAGPMPTPGVAMLTRSLRCDVGVMISASHNPHYDNGIKLFGPDGYKLSDQMEKAIEARIDTDVERGFAPPDKLGRATRLEDVQGRYIEYAKGTVPAGMTFDGLRVVVDCAHGAAYKVAPTVLWELGADVIPVGTEPDGYNINESCGSTHLTCLQEQVQTFRADLGVALDGDADRVIMVDENGQEIDGDQLMGLIATDWQARDRLKGGGLVATVMSNLGLERYLEGRKLTLARTQVGDRYVVEHMRKHGFNLGGEHSGHFVLNDFTTTGDGLLAALQVMTVIRAQDRPASDVCTVFERVPQMLKSVRYTADKPLEADSVKQAIADGRGRLGNAGRVVIRMSGTEPVVRVMAEGDDEALVAQVVDQICHSVERAA